MRDFGYDSAWEGDVASAEAKDSRAARAAVSDYAAPGAAANFLKRALDIAIVIAVAPVASAIVAVAALMIWREDRRSPLFVQERVGLGGRSFRMFKLRTMRPASEGASFTEKDDDRITRVGRYLRRTRIDELPQLLNVLRGEMSVIGPRPEAVALSREYQRAIPGYRERHAVRPGLTGWAQVRQGYAAGVEHCTEKLRYDVEYVRRASLWFDLAILSRTAYVVLTGFGSR